MPLTLVADVPLCQGDTPVQGGVLREWGLTETYFLSMEVHPVVELWQVLHTTCYRYFDICEAVTNC